MEFDYEKEYESDDSFFDDPKFTKKNSLTDVGKQKSVDDLFGSLDDKKSEKTSTSLENVNHKNTVKNKSADDLFGSLEDKKPERTSTSLDNVNQSPTKPKVRFDLPAKNQDESFVKSTKISSKNMDWLGGETPEPIRKDVSKGESKSLDLLDDILSSSTAKTEKKSLSSGGILDDILPRPSKSEKKTPSFEDILKESKLSSTSQKSSNDFQFNKEPVSKSTTGFLLEPPKEGRRGRRGSAATGVEDVLGLFDAGGAGLQSGPTSLTKSKSDEGVGKSLESVSSRTSKQDEVPDWLGGSTTATKKSDTTISIAKSESTTTSQLQEPQETYENPQVSENHVKNTQIENLSHQDLQNSFAALQQQESFLLVSMQLKKYEESLQGIKQQQDQILAKQEDQFQKFLNTYIGKHQAIEESIMEQQRRINQHIKNFMTSDSGISIQYAKSSANNDSEDRELEEETNLIKSLRQRHNEEFFLMEESYKKQITLLEKSSEALEERLTQEMSHLTQVFESKLEFIKKQHEREKNHLEEKIKASEEEHATEIAKLKQHHIRLINDLKDEHLEQIERLKEAKNRESELLSSGLEYTKKLDSNINILNNSSQTLQALQSKVVEDYDVLSLAREQSIQAREQEIVKMRVTLEKCRESAEKERAQLLGLVRSLEDKLAQQSVNSQEERWALQQAAATIAARSAAMDREADFSRAAIEREREQLKTLKETLLQEQEKIALQLTEEKLQMAAQQSKLEVSSKLVKNYEIEKIKAEAQAAIEAARDITEQVNQERDHIQREKNELDNLKRKLKEKERELVDKEMDLEALSRRVEGKISEDKKVMREAKYLEERYKEKLAELQTQAISLSNREKKLSDEKLLVSKERLALYTAMKQKKCVLCKAEGLGGQSGLKTFPLHDGGIVFDRISDPDLLKLRMEALTDEDRNSEVSREDSQK